MCRRSAGESARRRKAWRRLILSRWIKGRARTSRVPEGFRAYAIGDVHGRLDLLDGLLAQIEADHRERGGSASGLLVFLGDLIDRGPQSAEVVERVRSGPLPGFRTIALAGNHEEVLVRLLDEDEPGLFQQWLRFGGMECLQSYGEDADLLAVLPEEEALGRLRTTIPVAHQTFLRELGDSFSLGDYVFVHAGLRPGISLEQQSTTDLRWIRKAFLDDPRDHGAMVVHGHTITQQVDERRNRIGIDTGAFCFGVLTALCLENEERWYLQHRLTPESVTGELAR